MAIAPAAGSTFVSAAAGSTRVPAATSTAGMAAVIVASTLSAVAAARMHVCCSLVAAIPSPASAIDPSAIIEPCSTAINDSAVARADATGA